jgi:putative Ca2+/H+ antiporter (TMEM165/GDT1 family)
VNGFWISCVLSFWAEMGDKTQLVALAYATRYRSRDVIVGIAIATALVLLMSVAIGRLIASWLPIGYIQVASALCFFAFGVWTLRGDDEDESIREDKRHPILLIATAFFLAELGDKTMLTAVTLATQWPWAAVWLGATVGMLGANGLAVLVGKALGKRVPEKVMKMIAATLFFGFAAWSAFQAWRSFNPPS